MALPQRYVEKDFYTEAEYLAWEEDAPRKSEYVAGQIRMMSGGTDDHATLCMSVGAELRTALRGRGCRVMSEAIKVRMPLGNFRYPDITVVCGPSQFYGPKRLVLTNPIILVEVLSESTAITDQIEKLREYRGIGSVQSYLLVDQHAPRIEQYARIGNGHWDYQAVEGRENTVTIPALEVALALSDNYDGIDFEADRGGQAP